MTHDELLVRVKLWDDYAKGGYTPAVFQALRAVVELHKPTLNHHIHPMVDYCYQCQDGIPDEPYPCRTIQAIEKELK